jgi:hypothetical protein
LLELPQRGRMANEDRASSVAARRILGVMPVTVGSCGPDY